MSALTWDLLVRGNLVCECLSVFPQSCFSAEQLLQIYQLADNTSASHSLGRSGLARLSPALVQQIMSGACAETTETSSSDGLTETESK